MVPNELRYTEEHEWVRVDGDVAVIGITDHAQSELGDITFVELPKVGSPVSKGQSFSTVESVKAASDIYAPVSGNVEEVNDILETKPEVMNKSPYDRGWVCKVKMVSPGELESLMNAAAYEEFLKES